MADFVTPDLDTLAGLDSPDDQRAAARTYVARRVDPADRALVLAALGLDLASDREDVA